MAKKHVMVHNVLHSGRKLDKGLLCPDDLVADMVAKGLAAPLPEPVEPKEAPKAKAAKE